MRVEIMSHNTNNIMIITYEYILHVVKLNWRLNEFQNLLIKYKTSQLFQHKIATTFASISECSSELFSMT